LLAGIKLAQAAAFAVKLCDTRPFGDPDKLQNPRHEFLSLQDDNQGVTRKSFDVNAAPDRSGGRPTRTGSGGHKAKNVCSPL
jgi:hypothetical protein